MSLRSPLGRVLGQGAAHAGVRHWWHQRLTSIALVPLMVWFVATSILIWSRAGQPEIWARPAEVSAKA